MKKLLSAVLLTLVLSTSSYGAVSQDISVYVRQDVFEAKMEALRNEIQVGNEKILAEIRVMNTKIEEMDKRLTNQISAVEVNSSNRHEDLKTIVYWTFSGLGLLIAFAIFAPSFADFLRNLRRPSFTLEDIQKIVDTAIEAKLSSLPRA